MAPTVPTTAEQCPSRIEMQAEASSLWHSVHCLHKTLEKWIAQTASWKKRLYIMDGNIDDQQDELETLQGGPKHFEAKKAKLQGADIRCLNSCISGIKKEIEEMKQRIVTSLQQINTIQVQYMNIQRQAQDVNDSVSVQRSLNGPPSLVMSTYVAIQTIETIFEDLQSSSAAKSRDDVYAVGGNREGGGKEAPEMSDQATQTIIHTQKSAGYLQPSLQDVTLSVVRPPSARPSWMHGLPLQGDLLPELAATAS